MASETSHQLAKCLQRLSSAARMESVGDRELVERFASGRDADAFAVLVRRHGPMVLRVCRRILHDVHAAEDAFQATFLVLSRKATSLRSAETVGCWLHGVAFRLAQNALKQRARRQKHEKQAAVEKHTDDPLAEVSVREAQAILDEELAHLPEKYRAPLVLCCLEGRTRDEAARQLGWPVSIVKSRLEQARESLHHRLCRRGLSLPAALLATLLTEESAPAMLPDLLIRAAVQAARTRPSNGVSNSVSLLAESALGGMGSVKAKVIAGLLLLTAVLAAGMGAFAPLQQEAKQAPMPSAEIAPPKAEEHRVARTDRFGDPLPAGAVSRIGSVRWWCGSPRGELFNTLVYTPDGKSLVFSGDRDTVRFLDVATGKELRRIVIPEEGRRPCFALSPNGKTLVAANWFSSAFHIWDVSTGKELRRIENVQRGVDALAFSPDGKTFAVGTHKDLWLWDTATWKEIRRIAGKEDVGHYRGIFFLADGKTLISGDTGWIRWWDTVTGQVTRRINSNQYGGGFYRLTVSPDGKRLAVVHSRSDNHLLLLWDGVTGKEVRRIELGSKFAPSCQCFSPDSRILASGSYNSGRGNWDHQTLFFSAATGQELRRWDEGDDHAMQLAFSPDGNILARAMSGVIRLRDVKTGKSIVPVQGLPSSCLAVRFSRDGTSLIASCLGGRIGRWDPLTGESLTPLRDPPEGFGRQPAALLLCTALTNHGEKAALVNVDGVLHVWEPATGKVCCRIADPPVDWDSGDFSPDGKLVLVKHTDNIVRLWDARTGKLLRSLPKIGLVRLPHPCAFSPDSRTLAIGPAYPDNAIIRLFEAATGKEEGRIVWRDSTDVNGLLFTPDGKYLLAAHRRRSPIEGGPPERGDEEDALRLWDRASGREVRRIRIPVSSFQSITISRDGKTVAASDGDTIILWELASGAERGRFSGHREWIRSLAFSPDGRLLASGSLDHTACVWDVTGICPDGHWSLRRVKQDELERLWTDLGHKDGMRAYRALWRLAAAEPSATAFLAQHLRPVPMVEKGRLTRLIADLDSDRFETREHASVELRQLGEQAEPALRKALSSKPSLEASRRLRSLLDRVASRTLSPEQLHTLRAIEVLEHLGSPDARQVLQTLAEGAPSAMLTREAKAALERLTHKASTTP
jgi:RNA polymerase sigma factor (sigma-70 family)